MKRVYFLLLVVSLIAILFSNSSFAQTSTIMSATATIREIQQTFNFNPIKSVNISDDRVLSLAQAFGYPQPRELCIRQLGDSIYPMEKLANSSFFMLTEEGNQNTFYIYLPNVTITDFDYDKEDKMIYFCGIHQVTNSYNQNVIGYFHKDLLFGGNININLYPINIPNSSNSCFLKKIDFYRVFDSGDKKLSLIANDNANTFALSGYSNMLFSNSFFITYNLQVNDYAIKEVGGIRLTDVVHTKRRVVIVGIGDKEHLVLLSHKQNNINDYVGKVFETHTLYDFSRDMKYSIEALDNDTIIIGASVIADGYGRMEFTTFNLLSDITVMNTQSIANNNDIECRSKIVDMKYDKNAQRLHTIAFNGCNSRNMIFRLEPYNLSTHTSFIVIPNIGRLGRNLQRSITLYQGVNDPCYLVFGASDNQVSIQIDTIITGNLYFFDRKTYLFGEEYSCETVYEINIEKIYSKYTPMGISYIHTYNNLQSSANSYFVPNANTYTLTMKCDN